MYCTKCGLPTVNGERQCRECGTDIPGRGGSAVMIATARSLTPVAQPPRCRLAAWFMGLSAAGTACMFAATVIVLLLGRWGAAVTITTSGLALAGLCLLAAGFVLLGAALVFAIPAALRLRENPRLRGRGLMLAGLLLWVGGGALFMMLRKDPHFRPTVRPLVTTPALMSPAPE